MLWRCGIRNAGECSTVIPPIREPSLIARLTAVATSEILRMSAHTGKSTTPNHGLLLRGRAVLE
jgi:hypothetical protein